MRFLPPFPYSLTAHLLTSFGPGCCRANDLLADRTFMTESIKASIIARAERESSDEEEEYEGQYGEAFVEDEEGGRGFGVRDAGEGEEGELVVREREREGGASGTTTPAAQSGRNTPVVRPLTPFCSPSFGALTPVALPQPPPAPADPLANPFGPAVSHYLETTYLATPALFDRSSLVRRGKERKLLRERTGLGDEQIEGWRVMLERNVGSLTRARALGLGGGFRRGDELTRSLSAHSRRRIRSWPSTVSPLLPPPPLW